MQSFEDPEERFYQGFEHDIFQKSTMLQTLARHYFESLSAQDENMRKKIFSKKKLNEIAAQRATNKTNFFSKKKETSTPRTNIRFGTVITPPSNIIRRINSKIKIVNQSSTRTDRTRIISPDEGDLRKEKRSKWDKSINISIYRRDSSLFTKTQRKSEKKDKRKMKRYRNGWLWSTISNLDSGSNKLTSSLIGDTRTYDQEMWWGKKSMRTKNSWKKEEIHETEISTCLQMTIGIV